MNFSILQKEKKVEVGVRDLVRIRVSEFGMLIGFVEAITYDYIFLRNIVVTEPLVQQFTSFFKKQVIFYRHEIEGISVIGNRCNVKPLLHQKSNAKRGNT